MNIHLSYSKIIYRRIKKRLALSCMHTKIFEKILKGLITMIFKYNNKGAKNK